MRPVTYSLVSALIGTQSVLQSKCFAELVKATLTGDNQFNQPFVYFVIVNFICGLSFWLYRMNSALKMFDGLIIIPLLQVFWTTCAILQGGVFFQEFSKFSPWQSLCFLLGVLIVFLGVFMLTPHPKEKNGHRPELLPTDSDHSGHSSGSRSSAPTDTFAVSSSMSRNHLLHGLPQHSFTNSGLSCDSTRGVSTRQLQSNVSQASALMEESSMHSLFSLTFIPVVVERLEPVQQRRSRAASTSLGAVEAVSVGARAGPRHTT